jgi:hypothetical protein
MGEVKLEKSYLGRPGPCSNVADLHALITEQVNRSFRMSTNGHR